MKNLSLLYLLLTCFNGSMFFVTHQTISFAIFFLTLTIWGFGQFIWSVKNE